MTKKLNPLSFSAELVQKVLLNILFQVKAHYKCMYIIREREREIERESWQVLCHSGKKELLRADDDDNNDSDDDEYDDYDDDDDDDDDRI